MNRYRSYQPADDPPITDGDISFLGVDEYTTAENIKPGLVQSATNIDFTTQDAVTRGGFVCIPELGNIPFGQRWTSTTPASASSWTAVEFANGKFVAVGAGGAIMTSPDGTTWTTRTPPTTPGFTDVAYGNGLWVAVGGATGGGPNPLLTSADGITWIVPATAPAGSLSGVVYGNGLWVAIGDGRSATSADGVTWTNTTGITQLTAFAAKIAYANGLFVGIGSLLGSFATSTNGITWTTNTPSPTTSLTDVVYGNGLFVALSGTGVILTSPDGTTWTRRTAANSNFWFGLNYGNGTFIAVASSGSGSRAMSSTTGVSWLQMSNVPVQAWQSVAYGNNAWVSVGTNVSMVLAYHGTFVYGVGIYSDPDDPGSQWIMLVGTSSVGFYAFGKTSRSVSYGAGLTVTELSTIVQCNNQVYIFRGTSSVPLYWTGDWATSFALAPTPAPAPGFEIIPNSNQATFYQNRLWVKNGKDIVSASDALDFTTFDQLANEFNLNTGDSNYLVTTYPFGDNSLIVFKNRSILVLQNVQGSLADVTVTEITRQVGAIGINAVVSVGPDVVYMSDRNINLITLTSTNNAVQHKTLPLSQNIQKIFKRVNWAAAYKVSMGFNDNKLYVALPLDNSTVCNAVVVHNFITGQWFGEWNFSPTMGIGILGWAVATYLGLQRMHAITEDGRIFVTDEGPADISGTITAEISTSMTTRAYVMDNNNRVNRRMWADLSTWRPSFTITAYVDGASESSELITAQTYARSSSWIFSDSTYTLTNVNDDYNRAGRQDYAGYCSDSIQCQSGFLPQMDQDYRLPLLFRRKGRLLWLKIDNSQGFLSINSIGGEARAGDRSSLIQVI